MKWLNNFSLVMRSTIMAIEEKVQDPERMLRQLIIDMEEELQRVRDAVAGAIADEIQLRKAHQRARDEIEQWLQRAQSALARGDESAAQAALAQKLQCEQRADNLEAEHAKQKAQTKKLQESVCDLEDKIRQARQKQTLLLARMARASSQQNINRAMSSTSQRSAFAQFSRLEANVEREEAINEAYDRLDGRDPDADELRQQFEERERKAQLQSELEALKRQVQSDGS